MSELKNDDVTRSNGPYSISSTVVEGVGLVNSKYQSLHGVLIFKPSDLVSTVGCSICGKAPTFRFSHSHCQ
jgi:hypothetical protein